MKLHLYIYAFISVKICVKLGDLYLTEATNDFIWEKYKTGLNS